MSKKGHKRHAKPSRKRRPKPNDEIEVPVVASPKHSFLATVGGDLDGDELVLANGIRWKL